MKKIRIILAMSAVLLAVLGVFGSNLFPPAFTYYKHVPAGGGDPEECLEKVTEYNCITSGTVICATATETGVQLRRDNNISTDCGPLMWKQ